MTDALSEVDRNYEAFVAKLPSILSCHHGKYALLHNAEIIQYFDSALSAVVFGSKHYENRQYSVQEVTDQQDDLGFYSHAGFSGQA